MPVARVRHLTIAACAAIGILVATRAGADTDATSARIYNGIETTAYPAVVTVGVLNRDGSGGLCSGTLIAPTVVLTAGHCLSFDPVAAWFSPPAPRRSSALCTRCSSTPSGCSEVEPRSIRRPQPDVS